MSPAEERAIVAEHRAKAAHEWAGAFSAFCLGLCWLAAASICVVFAIKLWGLMP